MSAPRLRTPATGRRSVNTAVPEADRRIAGAGRAIAGAARSAVTNPAAPAPLRPSGRTNATTGFAPATVASITRAVTGMACAVTGCTL